MLYVQRLLGHPAYQKLQQDIKVAEAERIYCRHTFSHSLDVCRIAWILFLEDHADGSHLEQGSRARADWKEIIYLTGLLHDIGRVTQYETGEHHSVAGRRIAEKILADIDCPGEWREEILSVIALHVGRNHHLMQPGSLGDYICRADHNSRNCFYCEATDTCKWLECEKNTGISE